MERPGLTLVCMTVLLGGCATDAAPDAKATGSAKVAVQNLPAPIKADSLMDAQLGEQPVEASSHYDLVPETYPLVPDYGFVAPAPQEYAMLGEYALVPETHELVGEVYEVVPDGYEMLPDSYELLR